MVTYYLLSSYPFLKTLSGIIFIIGWIVILKRNKNWFCYTGLISSIISLVYWIWWWTFQNFSYLRNVSNNTRLSIYTISSSVNFINEILCFVSFYALAMIIYKNNITFKSHEIAP